MIKNMNNQKLILISLSLLFFIIGIVMGFVPRDMFIEAGSILAVIMISIPTFYGIRKIYGPSGIHLIIFLGIFALIIETIGIHTGFPYSPFEYTMPFGYRLFGTTPWTVFIAWSPLVIAAFILAQSWFKKKWTQFLVYIGILVSSDLVLDPGAVARGLWEYPHGGVWFNVPLQNFFGWIISGSFAYLLIKIILKNKKSTHQKYIWITSLSLIFSLFLWAGVNLVYGLWIPALVGIILGNIFIFGLNTSIQKTSH